jgi:phage-related minor tail protein
LRRLATSLQGDSVFDDDEIIQKTITQLLTFTNIAGTAFDRGAQAALNMSTVLGQDLQSSAIQVGKALNDPVAGVTALQRCRREAV